MIKIELVKYVEKILEIKFSNVSAKYVKTAIFNGHYLKQNL